MNQSVAQDVAPGTAIREVVRELATQPDGVSIDDLVAIFDGGPVAEQIASDAVYYLLTSCAVEGHRVDGGPWRYYATTRASRACLEAS